MKQRDLGRAQRRGRREAGTAAVGGKEGRARGETRKRSWIAAVPRWLTGGP